MVLAEPQVELLVECLAVRLAVKLVERLVAQLAVQLAEMLAGSYLEIEMFAEFLEIEVEMEGQEMAAADHILKIEMKKLMVFFIKYKFRQ